MQRFLESPAGGGASGEAAADALAHQLAEWAADNGQMQALSEMPLPAAVEHALLGWLVTLLRCVALESAAVVFEERSRLSCHWTAAVLSMHCRPARLRSVACRHPAQRV